MHSGEVQISVDSGSNWQTISRRFGENSNVWTQFVVDLSDYSGMTVQLAFLFTSNFGSEARGWFIDDISVIKGVLSFCNVEDFTNGIGNWYADHGVWEVGVSTDPAVPESPVSGGSVAGTVLNGNYPANASSRLISPKIKLVPLPGENPRLRFQHFFQLV